LRVLPEEKSPGSRGGSGFGASGYDDNAWTGRLQSDAGLDGGAVLADFLQLVFDVAFGSHVLELAAGFFNLAGFLLDSVAGHDFHLLIGKICFPSGL
jgi:hypothetical protein